MKTDVKKRINISISPELHAWATGHARSRGDDFSGYLSRLIADDQEDSAATKRLGSAAAGAAKAPASPPSSSKKRPKKRPRDDK